MAHSKNSPFLDLPPELRGRICTYILAEDQPIDIRVVRGDKRHWKPPALLAVCKIIRKEAQQFYYGVNIFTLHNRSTQKSAQTYMRDVMPWLRVIGKDARGIIARFNIEDKLHVHPKKGKLDAKVLRGYHDRLAWAGVKVKEGSLWIEVHPSPKDGKHWFNGYGWQGKMGNTRRVMRQQRS